MLTLLSPHVLVGDPIATQQGAVVVPPVHRYPDGQQVFPQHEASYEQQPPLGQSSIKFGHPCRRNKLNLGLNCSATGSTAFKNGCPSGLVSDRDTSRDGIALTTKARRKRAEKIMCKNIVIVGL
jgi:hypothetical protein